MSMSEEIYIKILSYLEEPPYLLDYPKDLLKKFKNLLPKILLAKLKSLLYPKENTASGLEDLSYLLFLPSHACGSLKKNTKKLDHPLFTENASKGILIKIFKLRIKKLTIISKNLL